MKTIRVVLFMDASTWAANQNQWFASSQPAAPPTPDSGVRRYQVVVEIPDPRAADELVRGQVTEVPPETAP